MSGGVEDTVWTERRREGHPRVAVRLPTKLEPVDPASTAFPGQTENVSPGGLCLRQAGGLAAGALVRVTLRLRQHLALTMLGTVMWAHPLLGQPSWDLGIAFREPLPSLLITEIVTGPPTPKPPEPRPPGEP